MKNLADYVMIIDDCLSEDVCKSLIDKFDVCEQVNRDSSWDIDYKSFSEINLTTHPEFEEEQTIFYNTTKKLYQFYKEKCGIQFVPDEIGYEDVRMKRYLCNDRDQFGWHADVGDYASARRFLVMFYYLNDVKEGGQTEFFSEQIKVTPKRGRAVIFPPMWMYPHRGCKPISGSKYIVSTYCHYL